MNYRREIDGLRALAVMPVILFHAGFRVFSGGFVGVDVFFAISGYLISSIILMEIERGSFSVVRFYERRARRILPALFLIMGCCVICGYAWMMPDEYKNLGQSLVATTFFSNNILLALTTGYWDMASEFKPLLHTWSLGVEEQFYVLFPLTLILIWRFARKRTYMILAMLLLGSLASSLWSARQSPTWVFYNLPTRAWEILVGALAAIYLMKRPALAPKGGISHIAGLLGLALILIPVFLFKEDLPSPGLSPVAPVLGAALIILYGGPGTAVNAALGSRFMVGIGLISYSAYLWHQPLFAFQRIRSKAPPGSLTFCSLIVATFALSYLSWRFVEKPFRNPGVVGRNALLATVGSGSLVFVLVGLILNEGYGLPSRVFNSDVKIGDVDKRAYNEKVFLYQKGAFSHTNKMKVLVVGNSFARDFVNMTNETFDTSNVDLVYRSDLFECILPFGSSLSQELFGSAAVIVFGNGMYRKECIDKDISFASKSGKKIFYLGPKNFGYNLNWLTRLGTAELPNQYNALPAGIVTLEAQNSAEIPREHYLSLMAPTEVNDRTPITDEAGRMLSTDRMHLTKYGAVYFGRRALLDSPYGKLFARPST
jgi:peptidoglycan/LPS O-acetylase OafA/YrhL